MTNVICPNCGAEMKLHAEKLMEPRNPAEVREVDPELGALVEEFYTCPKCGASFTRRGH